MNYRTAILKGFQVHVVWGDLSAGTTEFKSQNGAKAYINGLDLSEVRRVRLSSVWSEPGETVEVEMKYQK